MAAGDGVKKDVLNLLSEWVHDLQAVNLPGVPHVL